MFRYIYLLFLGTFGLSITSLSSDSNIPFLTVYANKLGSIFNVFETYSYDMFPLCPHDSTLSRTKFKHLLTGNQLLAINLALPLFENSNHKLICRVSLSKTQMSELFEAIKQRYYVQYFFDSIPLYVILGEFELDGLNNENQIAKIYNHLHFIIRYNSKKILSADVDYKNSKSIALELSRAKSEITFSYSINWEKTPQHKLDSADMNSVFPLIQINIVDWHSSQHNILIVAIILLFLLSTFKLKRDLKLYNQGKPLEAGENPQDHGWKLISGDVFRPPSKFVYLFCAIMSTGCQSIVILFSAFIYFHYMRIINKTGALIIYFLIAYFITQPILGYASSRLYHSIGGINWVRNLNITSLFFLGLISGCCSLVYFNSLIYGATLAIQFSFIVLLTFLWAVLGYPLCGLGGVLGKNRAILLVHSVPFRTRNICREIPRLGVLRHFISICFFQALLQFLVSSGDLSQFLSLVFVGNSFEFGSIVFSWTLSQLVSNFCLSIAVTYWQLSGEDYRWWWRTVASSLGTGLICFVYCLYFVIFKTNIYGVVATTHYIAVAIIISLSWTCILSYLSFYISFGLVKFMYQHIKN